MRRKLDVSLVLACRNLEPNFLSNLRQILRTLSLSKITYELILIDDKSDDTTADTLKTFSKMHKKANPRVKVFFHSYQFGRSRTIAEGLQMAKAPVIGMMSPSLAVSPVYIPIITDTIATGDADVLVGRRIYSPKAFPFAKVANILRDVITNHMVDTAGVDVFSSLKFFNRKKIQRILPKVKDTGKLWDTELIIHAKRAGYKIAELPVVYRPRPSDVPLTGVWDEVTGFIRDIIRLWRRLYVKSRGHV